MGQRAGRISNVLSTFERELAEGDISNELTSLGGFGGAKILETEIEQIYKEMRETKNIKSFSVEEYTKGIQSLHALHFQLKEVI